MSVVRKEIKNNQSSKYLKIGLAYGIPLLFFTWAFHYINTHPQDFLKLFSLPLTSLLLLVLIQILSVWVSSLFTYVMVKPYGINLNFHEYFGITTIARSLNIILPMKGGAAVRGIYLKKKHGLSFTHFSAIFAGQTLLTLAVASLLGLIGIIWLYSQTGEIDKFGLSTFSFTSLFFFSVIVWSPKLRTYNNKVIQTLKNVLDSWALLRKDRIVIFNIIVISVLNTVLSSVSIALIFHAINTPQPLGTLLFLGGTQDLMYQVSLTPGALGIVEASTVFFGSNISISVSDALLVALVNRTSILLVSGILSPVYFYHLFKK